MSQDFFAKKEELDARLVVLAYPPYEVALLALPDRLILCRVQRQRDPVGDHAR